MSETMNAEKLRARLAQLDEDERTVRAEMKPLEDKRREHMDALEALRTAMRPFEERLAGILRERETLEERARWLDQSTGIGAAWAGFLAGKRDTILLASRYSCSGEVRPEKVIGEWVVHATIDSDRREGDEWTVTHGPSGLCAYRGPTMIAALGLAAQLAALEVPSDEYGRPCGEGALADTIRAHQRATR